VPAVDFKHPVNPIDEVENHGNAKKPLKFYNSEVGFISPLQLYNDLKFHHKKIWSHRVDSYSSTLFAFFCEEGNPIKSQQLIV